MREFRFGFGKPNRANKKIKNSVNYVSAVQNIRNLVKYRRTHSKPNQIHQNTTRIQQEKQAH